MEKGNPLEKLNSAFEIAEDAVLEISNDLVTIEARMITTDDSAGNDEILSFETLKQDYYFIKETIIQNIQSGKKLLDMVMKEQEGDLAVDYKIVASVSELIKANNGSLKELSGIFKEIKEIERLKKQNEGVLPTSENTTNNYFVGNLNDVLKLK